MTDPTSREVLVNGAVWVAVLALVATVLAHVVIAECAERGNWCDTIERINSHD